MRASKLKINNEYTDVYGYKPKERIIVPTAERDIKYVDIKGRSGSLTKKYGYRDIPLPIDFTMFDTVNGFKKTFRKTKQHLLNAETLIFDDDNEVYFKVKSIQIETAENLIFEFGEFTAQLVLEPFQYEISNNPITINSSQTIQNDGYTALPKIKVWCSGNGELTINNQTVQVVGVNGAIVINSELVQTYQEGSPPINASNKTVGDYPVLVTGTNSISFSGDISKLEVTPNFRWR